MFQPRKGWPEKEKSFLLQLNMVHPSCSNQHTCSLLFSTIPATHYHIPHRQSLQRTTTSSNRTPSPSLHWTTTIPNKPLTTGHIKFLFNFDGTSIENLTRFSSSLHVYARDLVAITQLMSHPEAHLSFLDFWFQAHSIDNIIHLSRPWLVNESLFWHDSFAMPIQNLMHECQASIEQVSYSVLG